jgi:hypothetical protein
MALPNVHRHSLHRPRSVRRVHASVAAHSITIVLDPVWDLFSPQPRVFVRPPAVRVDDQTRALLSVLVSRPPPISA